MGCTTRPKALLMPVHIPFVSFQGTSRYIGVYYRKGRRAFYTRDWNRGQFSSVQVAARAVGASRKLVKPSLLLHRMACMQAVFNQSELPADLEDLFVWASRLAVLAVHQPALEPFMIQLKYALWRSPLEQAPMAGYSTTRSGPPFFSLQLRARLLLQVLTQIANEVSKGGYPGHGCGVAVEG